MFCGGSGGFGGGGGFGSRAGGYWKKQYYGVQVGNDPFEWQGYDWVWVDDWTPDWNRINLFTPAVVFFAGTFEGMRNVAKEFDRGKLFVDSKGRITTKPVKMGPAARTAAHQYASSFRVVGGIALVAGTGLYALELAQASDPYESALAHAGFWGGMAGGAAFGLVFTPSTAGLGTYAAVTGGSIVGSYTARIGVNLYYGQPWRRNLF